MNEFIENAARTHSPQHAAMFRQACGNVHERDIRGHAAAIRKVCEREGILAMENPYPAETQGRTEWNAGWEGIKVEAAPESAPEPKPEPADFSNKTAFPNKDTIVAFVAEHHGVTLNSDDFTRPALEAEAARIQAEA